MAEIINSNDKPCQPRRRVRTSSRTPIIHSRPTPHPVACYSDFLSDDGLLVNACDDISFDDLHESVGQKQEQLALYISTEFLKKKHESEDKSWRDFSDACRQVSQLVTTLEKKLPKFWYYAAEFSRGHTQCQGRYVSRQSSYLKQYLELVLDFEPSNHYLGSGGRLERALHDAQQLLSKSAVWSSDGFDFKSSFSSSQTAKDTFLAENQKAQLRLQELSAYEELLDTEFQNVKEQLQQLRSVEDALDEEQREREMEQRQSDQYMERLERFIREVTIRLQMFVVLLFLFCKFSGISDNDQPMCITMPWNIRPALIVLWGVCWMFYPPQDYVDPSNTQDAELYRNVDFPGLEWTQWSSGEPSRIPGLDLFSYDQDMITQQPMLPGAAEVSIPFLVPGFFEHQALGTETLNGIRYEQGPDSRAAFDPKVAFNSSNPISPWEASTTFQTISDHQSRLANGQLEDLHARPIWSASQPIDRPSTQGKQSMLPSRPPSGFERPQQPMPYGSESRVTCEHVQCSGLMFDHLSEWKKHDDRVHNRQTCDVSGCTQSFGSKGELYRHKQTKHNHMPPHKLLLCLETNCKYSITPHFKRKDHLIEHLKRIHKYSHADAKAKANSEARPQPRSHSRLQAEPQSISFEIQPSQAISTSAAIATPAVENSPQQDRIQSIMPGSSKKRRLSKNASHPVEAPHFPRELIEEPDDDGESWKRKAVRYERDMEALRAQNISLRTQNELLESRIQKLEKNQDSLIAVLAAGRPLVSRSS